MAKRSAGIDASIGRLLNGDMATEIMVITITAAIVPTTTVAEISGRSRHAPRSSTRMSVGRTVLGLNHPESITEPVMSAMSIPPIMIRASTLKIATDATITFRALIDFISYFMLLLCFWGRSKSLMHCTDSRRDW
ncbi:MAG: hypothetical protein BA870_03270 [Desulfuromonadales bacterium C00003094]|nr:MAG: hypothetical protein BA870_03270 [Desulfuromonadales bacterium C00003094]